MNGILSGDSLRQKSMNMIYRVHTSAELSMPRPPRRLLEQAQRRRANYVFHTRRAAE